MYNKEKTIEFLDRKGIKYEKIEHAPVFTMEEMEEAGITAKGTVCKNLFLRDMKGKVHYLVTVPAKKQVNLASLADKIYSTKLSFASAERLDKYLGLKEGSVSPLGILNDESRSVIMVFDKELMGKTDIGIHPNDNTATLFMSFSDIEKIIKEHDNEIMKISL